MEGFELEVIKGLGEILHNRQLQSIFLEVHFLALAERGMEKAPFDIVNILTTAGFKITWTDPSHLVAER